MASVDSIVRAAVAGDDIVELFQGYQRESGVCFAAAMDGAMVAVAMSYLRGSLSYSDADSAANKLYTLMLNAAGALGRPVAVSESDALPRLAWAIFEAFDQGEYDHGDGLDPVEHYTIPMLQSALGERELPSPGC